jgi:general L-amino acid transport system permease protein
VIAVAQQSASPTTANNQQPPALIWIRENLFSSPANTILTLVMVALLVLVAQGFISWALQAKWAVIPANFRVLMVGTYPVEQLWRVWSSLIAVCLAIGFQWGQVTKPNITTWGVLAGVAVVAGLIFSPTAGLAVATLATGVFIGQFLGQSLRLTTPVFASIWTVVFFGILVLLGGNFGGGAVATSQWGGLLLTVLLAVVSIVLSFPLGVLLAVGRTSRYPIISGLSTVYIEVLRGVPLISVLFLAQYFVPLFVPDIEIDPIIRAIVGLTLFTAAYLAENIRGGLQAIPRGQDEAARALGLNPSQTMLFIVLPQAIRLVIPAIVGQFITLFKDTSLVSIIPLGDVLGISRSVSQNPDWVGTQKELYFGVGVIYVVFSAAMSAAARRLEKQLTPGSR